MKQIRRNVFETNSSSTHSVSIGQKGAGISCLEITQYNERCNYEPGIIIDTVGFCSFCDHNTQEEKLAYVMQQIAYMNGFFELFWSTCPDLDQTLEEYYNCDDFKELEREICDYTGANCLRFGNLDGYIDHDSIVYNKYELMDEIGGNYVNFIFDPDSYVHFEFNG